MREITNEAKVGFLVLLAAGATVWAVRRTGERIDGVVYYATLESAAGLAKSSQVEIAGVPIGRIEDVSEREGKARIRFTVRKDRPLPVDSAVTTVSDSPLGDRRLKVIPGKDVRILPERSTLRTAPPAGDIDAIVNRVDRIAENVEAITFSMRNAMATDEGRDDLARIVGNLAQFTDDLAALSAENHASINRIVVNLEALSGRLNELAERSGGKLDASLASIESVAAKIDRGDGTIGRLVNDGQTVEGINDAIGGVNEVLERVNRTHLFVNYQGEAQVVRADDRDGSIKNAFSVRIQPRQDYGYVVGVSDDPDGFRRRTRVLTVEDPDGAGPAPPTESVTETEKTTSDYLVTAQIYKRFGPMGGRIGVKENSGAVGADIWLLRDRLKVSADVWQFAREEKGSFGAIHSENPRVKLQARYDLPYHVYFVGGVDDLASRYDRRALFVGAGLEFNDDDLKLLLGSLPSP